MSRRLINTAVRTLALLSLTTISVAWAQGNGNAIENIVLVHGAWADGSSWSKVIPLLAERGFRVVAVQNPLTSLHDDVTTTNQAIERLQRENPGPVLLVGHSYGGTVITEAGGNANVKGLVYVAAFAPEENQSTLGLASLYPSAPLSSQYLQDAFGSFTLSRQGIFENFAQDVTRREKEQLFAAQGPTAAAAFGGLVTTPAWRTKPSWFMVAANDRAIPPELEQMEAKRMNAVTITVPTSHVAMIAEPRMVADFIAQAARSLGRK